MQWFARLSANTFTNEVTDTPKQEFVINDISEEERAMVNQMSLKYVVIEREIKRFNKISSANSSANSHLISKVKYRLMREIYQSSAKVNFNFF